VDVDELLKNLKLHGEELNEVVLGKEEVRRWPAVKWLAAGKVLTRKTYSIQSLKNSLMAAWSTAHDVIFHEVEANLFVLQAFCLGDWKRIMEDGPWLFRGCALMVEPFDGATSIPSVIPKGVQAWVQIHKIPILFRNKEVLNLLAQRVGEIIAVEMSAVQTSGGVFHRVRVMLDSTKPLTRFVPLAMEGSERIFLQIKYEKVPKHCEFCGYMGHTYLECGSGEHEEADLQFGPWMLADETTWKPGTPGARPGFFREPGGGRGRGQTQARGRGTARFNAGTREQRKWVPRPASAQRKRNSAEAGLEEDGKEMEDTATSPLKPPGSSEGGVHTGVKKSLDMNVVADIGGSMDVPPPPPAYITPSEKKKKLKRAEVGVSGDQLADASNLKSTAAPEGGRQEQ
jgi:hypothetical protein